MLDFVLNFLGLRPSGFKRKKTVFNFIGKIRSSRNDKKTTNYLIASMFSGFIFVCDIYNVSYIEELKYSISPYFIKTKCFANELISFPKILSDYMNIKSENNRLRMDIDALKIKITTANNIENEFMKLKNSVNLKYSVSTYKSIEKVLGFDKSVYESFLVISANHTTSKKGSVVISSDGLVGLIFDSFNDVARVMTIADQKICIPVKTISGEHLIISGNGKNSMISKEIKENNLSSKIRVVPGEILYTSGEGGIFQANIPVAVVTGIQYDSLVIAEPISNIDDISYVWTVSPFFEEIK